MSMLTVSVVIPTYNRVDYIGTCLEHVFAQSRPPVEVVVVDASSDHAAEETVRRFSGVTYVRSPFGRGTTATSRALGIERTTGDIIAFLDDDAYPHPDWLERLMARYEDPEVAGVGGRAINGQPGEEHDGVDRVGRLNADGSLSGFFAAVTEHDVDVDHLLGANMSMRRSVIEDLGGIRDLYPGTCLREESDIALRARAAGYRLVYAPDAVVRHVGGTYAHGHRFDRRYEYYAARNHAVLLITALGPDDPRTQANPAAARRKVGAHLRYATRSLTGHPGGSAHRLRGVANGLSRAFVTGAGTIVGTWTAHRYLKKQA